MSQLEVELLFDMWCVEARKTTNQTKPRAFKHEMLTVIRLKSPALDPP